MPAGLKAALATQAGVRRDRLIFRRHRVLRRTAAIERCGVPPLATLTTTQYSPVMSFLNPPKAEIRRRRILVGFASVVLTTLVMTAFLLESRSGYSKPDARVILFQSWPADRDREDTLADQRATRAAQEAKLAESRAYIASLSGEARIKAQEQYEAYVTGGGADKEIPYVAAEPVVR